MYFSITFHQSFLKHIFGYNVQVFTYIKIKRSNFLDCSFYLIVFKFYLPALRPPPLTPLDPPENPPPENPLEPVLIDPELLEKLPEDGVE